jgi:hypothetical protein
MTGVTKDSLFTACYTYIPLSLLSSFLLPFFWQTQVLRQVISFKDDAGDPKRVPNGCDNRSHTQTKEEGGRFDPLDSKNSLENDGAC